MPVPQQLRHRVQVMKPVTITDTHGDTEEVLQVLTISVGGVDVVLDNVAARVQMGPGRYGEILASDQIVGDVAARITLRWFPGLESKHVIVWDGHYFGINGIPQTDETGRREYRLQCMQREPQNVV